jgi:hypothetical protein
MVWDSMLRPGTQLLAFLLAFFGLGGTESEGFDNFCCPRRVAPVPLMLAIVKDNNRFTHRYVSCSVKHTTY